MIWSASRSICFLLAALSSVLLIIAPIANAQQWHRADPKGEARGDAVDAPTYAQEQAKRDQKVRDLLAPLTDVFQQEQERRKKQKGPRFKSANTSSVFVPNRQGELEAIYTPKFIGIEYLNTFEVGLEVPATGLALLRSYSSGRALQFKRRTPDEWEVEEIRAVCRSLVRYAEGTLADSKSETRYEQFWVGLTSRIGRSNWGETASAKERNRQTVFVFTRENGCDGDWSIWGEDNA